MEVAKGLGVRPTRDQILAFRPARYLHLGHVFNISELLYNGHCNTYHTGIL